MDWSASEWKQALPSTALQKVTAMEEQLERLQKNVTQKQLQLDQFDQVLGKEKQKTIEHKNEEIRLLRELEQLTHQCNESHSQLTKCKMDLAQKSYKVDMLERLTGKRKPQMDSFAEPTASAVIVDTELFQLRKMNDKLLNENKALRLKIDTQQPLPIYSPPVYAEKIGTPSKGRAELNSNDQIEKLRSEKIILNDKVVNLENRLKQVTAEIECQRHNYEATKSSLEIKSKERECNLKEELKQQSQMVMELEKLLKEGNIKLSQAQMQVASMESLKSAFEKEKLISTAAEKLRLTLEQKHEEMMAITHTEFATLHSEFQMKQNEVHELTQKLDVSYRESVRKDEHIRKIQDDFTAVNKECAEVKEGLVSEMELLRFALQEKENNLTNLTLQLSAKCEELSLKDSELRQLLSEVEVLKTMEFLTPEIKDDLRAKESDIASLMSQLNLRCEEVKSKENRILQLEEKVEQLTREIAALMSVEIMTPEIKQDLQSTKSLVDSLSAQMDLKREELSSKEEVIRQMDEHMVRLTNETTHLKSVEELTIQMMEDIKVKENCIADLTAQLNSQREESIAKENSLRHLEAYVLQLTQEIANLKTVEVLTPDIKEDLLSKEAQIVSLMSQLSLKCEEVSSKEMEIQRLEGKLIELDCEISTLKAVEVLTPDIKEDIRSKENHIESLITQLDVKCVEISSKENVIQQLEAKLTQLRSEVEMLKTVEAFTPEMKEEWFNLNRDMQEKQRELEEVSSKLDHVLQELSTKEDLNNQYHNLVQRLTDDSNQLKSLLLESETEKETLKLEFQSLFNDKDADFSVLRNDLVVKESRLAELVDQIQLMSKDATSKGEVNRQLSERLGELSSEISHLKSTLSNAVAEKQRLELELDQSAKEHASRLVVLEKDFTVYQNQFLEKQERLEGVIQELTFKNELVEQLQSKLESLKSGFSMAEARWSQKHLLCSQLEEALAKANEELSQLKSDFEAETNSFQIDLESKGCQIANLMVDLSSKSEELQQTEDNFKGLLNDSDERHAEIKTLVEESELAFRAKIDSLEESVRQKEDAISSLKTQAVSNGELTSSLENAQAETRKTQEELVQLTLNFNNAMIENSSKEALNNMLENHVQELLSEAAVFKSEIISVEDEKRQLEVELETLKTEISSDLAAVKDDLLLKRDHIAELQESLSVAAEEIVEKAETISRLEKEVETATSMDFQRDIEALKVELQQKDCKITTLLEKLESDAQALALNRSTNQRLEEEVNTIRMELDQLKGSNESFLANSLLLMEENRVKDDTMKKLEEEINSTIASLVEKNNYINQCQASMGKIRLYFSNQISSGLIMDPLSNKVPDSSILDLLLEDLVNKKKSLTDLRKMTDERVALIDSKLRLLHSYEQCDCPLDEILLKIQNLKAFLIQKKNELLDTNSGDGDSVDASTMSEHKSFKETSVELNDNLTKAYENLARKLEVITEDVLRIKSGQSTTLVNSEVDRLTNDIVAAEEEKTVLRESLVRLETEKLTVTEQLESRLSDMKRENETLLQESNLARQYADEVVEELGKLEQQAKDFVVLKDRNSQLEYETKHLKECLDSLEARNKELEGCLEKFQIALDEVAILKSNVVELEDQVNQSKSQASDLENLRTKWVEASARLESVQKKVEELEIEKENWMACESELKVLGKHLEMVEGTKLDVINLGKSLKDKLSAYEAKLASLQAERGNSERVIGEMSDQVKDLNENLERQNAMYEEKARELLVLQAQLGEAIRAREKDATDVTDQMKEALELYEVVKEKDSTLLQLKELLEETEKAFGEIKLELSETKAQHDMKNRIMEEKENTIREQSSVIEKLEASLSERQMELNSLQETLTESHVSDKMTLMEHRILVLQTEMNIIQQEKIDFIENCEKLEEQLSIEKKEKEAMVEELKASVDKREILLYDQIKSLQIELQAVQSAKIKLVEKCETLKTELCQATQVDTSNSAQEECLRAKESELQETSARLKDAEAKEAAALLKVQELEDLYTQTETVLKNFQVKMEELTTCNGELEKDKSSLKGRIFLANKMLKSGENDRVKLDREYQLLQKNFDDLKLENAKIDRLYKELEGKFKEIEKELKSVETKLQNHEEQISCLTRQNTTISSELAKEREEKCNLMVQLEESSKQDATIKFETTANQRTLRNRKQSISPDEGMAPPAMGYRTKFGESMTPFSKVPKLNLDEPVMTRSARRRSLSAGNSDVISAYASQSNFNGSTSKVGRKFKVEPPSSLYKRKENKPLGISQSSRSIGSSTAVSATKTFLPPPMPSAKKPSATRHLQKSSESDDKDCKVQ